MRLPLNNGDVIESTKEIVRGEIARLHMIEGGVCWTDQGNWYRRGDGVQVALINGLILPYRKVEES